MSDNWMTHSFFPLLPLDPNETPAISVLSTAPSIPSQTATKVTQATGSSTTEDEQSVDRSPCISHPAELSPSAPQVSLPSVDSILLPSKGPTDALEEEDMEGLELSSGELAMFSRIIASGCIIKSQQRGDPDLSYSQLCSELDKLLRHNPGSFLTRYGKYLNVEDLSYFDSIPKRNDFEVNFTLKRLRQTLQQSSKSRQKRIRNRRYECLQQLMAEASYFSEEEMRQRNPLLYDFYIGQYLSKDEEQNNEAKNTDMTLSSMILNQMDQDKTADLLRRQRRSETEELSMNAAASAEERVPSNRKWKMLKPMELSSDIAVAEREKHMLRQEFLAAMQANFLEGKDEEFDYSKVDDNEKYDSLDMREKDEQDSYFDEEEPSWCSSEECVDSEWT